MEFKAELKGADKAIDLCLKGPERARIAAARAINDSLKDAQVLTGKEILPDAFTLRGRGKQWWEPGQKFGFNVRPYANPNTLEGRLGSQADWVKLQEFGGTKEADGHRVAVPADDYKPKTAIMARRIKPRAILNRKDTFKATLKSGFSGVFRRIDSGLKLLFSLTPSAKVEKRLSFERDAAEIANKRMNPNFARRFIQLLK